MCQHIWYAVLISLFPSLSSNSTQSNRIHSGCKIIASHISNNNKLFTENNYALNTYLHSLDATISNGMEHCWCAAYVRLVLTHFHFRWNMNWASRTHFAQYTNSWNSFIFVRSLVSVVFFSLFSLMPRIGSILLSNLCSC